MRRVREAIARKGDAEGAYYLLGRALFAAGKYQDVVDLADAAIATSGEDYNIYVPIINSFGALGKNEARRNSVLQRIQVLEAHLKKVPEDARGRTLLATDYANLERAEDAMREAHLAMALRPNDAMVLYNVACVFGQLARSPRRSRRCARRGTRAGRTPPGRAATPTSRSSTATRTSRSCTRRRGGGVSVLEMQR